MNLPANQDTVAAIDLGSNSFHMLLARLLEHETRVVDRVREVVRLASGLDDQEILSGEAQERALACLQRFSERIRHLPPGHVRAVGTNTFRKASNAREFIRRAEAILGHPIEVVAGQEEARLIYLGMIHSTAPRPGRRLVIDIGGGSTEIILGEGSELIQAESLDVGCVSFSQRFFTEGKLRRKLFDRAVLAAQIEFHEIADRFPFSGWEFCLGTSGTVHATQGILRTRAGGDDAITHDGLLWLRDQLIEARHLADVSLPGLNAERKPVLPGGVAILLAAFESLAIDRMQATPGGLREGVLHDLIGRFRHEDIRDVTIRGCVRRYQADEAQGHRVERIALKLRRQVADAWNLQDPQLERLLGWAARLHEIGLAIAHSGFHKHGEYVIRNSDMPGFSTDDQIVLATLVRCHRRKLPLKNLEALPHLETESALRLVILLRLAVILSGSRHAPAVPPLELRAGKSELELAFAGDWLERHPLTRAELEKEALILERCGYRLVLPAALPVLEDVE